MIKISNPMDDFLKNSLKRKKSKSWLDLNKKLTYSIIEFNFFLNNNSVYETNK